MLTANFNRLLICTIVAFAIDFLIFLLLKATLQSSWLKNMRILFILSIQLIPMPLASYILYYALSSVIDSGTYKTACHNHSKSNRGEIFRIVSKGLMWLLILAAPALPMFNFILLGEEPNYIALALFGIIALYLHLLTFLVFVELLYLLSKKTAESRFANRPSSFIITHILPLRMTAIILSVAMVVGGICVAFSSPSIRTVNVSIKNLPNGQENLGIALLTDLHIGPTVGRSNIEEVVALTNSLRPDIVAIVGDLADGFMKELGKAALPLKDIKSVYGTYFATGNHEYQAGNVTELIDFISHLNVRTLRNEHVNIRVGRSLLCLAGVDDLVSSRYGIPGHGMNYKSALDGCANHSTVILLVHQPNAARMILEQKPKCQKIDLILSGHTHGGQMYITLPIIYMFNAFFHGLYFFMPSQTHVFVSAGTNYFGPPVKVFGGREIILLRLLSM